MLSVSISTYRQNNGKAKKRGQISNSLGTGRKGASQSKTNNTLWSKHLNKESKNTWLMVPYRHNRSLTVLAGLSMNLSFLKPHPSLSPLLSESLYRHVPSAFPPILPPRGGIGEWVLNQSVICSSASSGSAACLYWVLLSLLSFPF